MVIFTGFAIIMPSNCQCHIDFPVCSRFFINRASQAFLRYSQFFPESELQFSRNHYIIIPFQIEWPDHTSEVSMDMVAFCSILSCLKLHISFLLRKRFWQILKVMITCILAFLTGSQYLIFRIIQYNSFLKNFLSKSTLHETLTNPI